MQRAIKYKTNSVIYFAMDVPDRVYILQSGKIALNSIDDETNTPVSRQIKPGELFGVKSVLGKYPRDETAVVLSDAVVYAFNEDEFEAFIIKNPRLILQMVKIYSKQLRRVHGQIKNLINQNSEKDEEINSENADFTADDGLFSVAEVFFKSKHFSICIEVCKRYLKTYKQGKHFNDIKKLLLDCQGKRGLDIGIGDTKSDVPDLGVTYSSLDRAKKTEDAQHYEDAYLLYSEFFTSEDALEAENALLGASRCLLKLEKYVEIIKLLSMGIKRNTESHNIPQMLFYIGKAYEKMGQVDKAQAFYSKSEQIDMQTQDSEIMANHEIQAEANEEHQSQFQRFAKEFKKGELIFAEYESGDTFYLIKSGQVQLIKAVNGYEKNLDILQPHEFFGEMAILDNSPRSASAIAYDDVKLLEFNKENFELLVTNNPEIVLVLLKTFVRRIYAQKRRYKVLTIQDKRVRLADVFLMLDETLTNLDRSTEMRIFQITLDDLARWASMTLAETQDNISKFLGQGYIEVYEDRIVIQNMTLLKRFVQSRTQVKNEQY